MVKRKPPTYPKRVRFTEAGWRLVEAVAAANGQYPSTWLREVAEREARRELATEQ
jgi:hypothetical protein